MKVECKCIVCGKLFYQYPSRVKQGIKCCGNGCKSKRMVGNGNHNYNGGNITEWGYKMISVNGVKVYEHRYVMEQHLKRKLKKGEEVHHIDGNKLNNNIDNLELLTTGEHKKHHRNPVNGQFVSRVIETKNKEDKK